MDAIITAGGTNSADDPLYSLTQVQKKALMPLVGRPMINWVIEALLQSEVVDNLVIVGLTADDITVPGTNIHFVEGAGELIDNILVALARVQALNPSAQKFLLCSSDIPLITPEIVRGFVAECGSQEADIYYTVVEKQILEAQFPNSKRTFIPFKGGRYSGGDIFLADVSVSSKIDLDLLRSLTGSRKNYWNQARLLGFNYILRFLLGTMTIQDAAHRIGEIFKIKGQVVETKFAEVGMDLDKPRHYELIKAHLEQKMSQPHQV
jgi:molybdopterin-guanine dinucleotide biosynthesis protein A